MCQRAVASCKHDLLALLHGRLRVHTEAARVVFDGRPERMHNGCPNAGVLKAIADTICIQMYITDRLCKKAHIHLNTVNHRPYLPISKAPSPAERHGGRERLRREKIFVGWRARRVQALHKTTCAPSMHIQHARSKACVYTKVMQSARQRAFARPGCGKSPSSNDWETAMAALLVMMGHTCRQRTMTGREAYAPEQRFQLAQTKSLLASSVRSYPRIRGAELITHAPA